MRPDVTRRLGRGGVRSLVVEGLLVLAIFAGGYLAALLVELLG